MQAGSSANQSNEYKGIVAENSLINVYSQTGRGIRKLLK